MTLIIILAALLLGLWMDRTFNTRPVITLVMILGSIPVSLLVMLFVARKAVNQIKSGSTSSQNSPTKQEETNLGNHS